MNGLYFLNSEHFTIQQSKQGNILCHNIEGISLVLFYVPGDINCVNIFKTFKGLPGTLNGCQFAVMNVELNNKYVSMSRETVEPIKYIPLVLLYKDGVPVMRYEGKYDTNSIRRFVIDNKRNREFVSEPTHEEQKPSRPEYCKIGDPLCGFKNKRGKTKYKKITIQSPNR